jgi:predicted transcriptional regulator
MTETQQFTLPENLRVEVEKVARAQERTVNEVLADAVDRYVKDEQWQSLKAYGSKQAQARGIREDDVLRLIAESRREHNQGR